MMMASLRFPAITSRDLSSLHVGEQGTALSRSVEHIYSAPLQSDSRKFPKPPGINTSKLGLGGVGAGLGIGIGLGSNGSAGGGKGFGLGMKGTWGSISRVFSRTKNRKALDSAAYFEAQLQAGEFLTQINLSLRESPKLRHYRSLKYGYSALMHCLAHYL
jgi:hypothetical protein